MTGYVLKMFPRFSETFILAEILELERRGRALDVVSLRKPDDGRFHEDLARVRAGVTYLPEHVRCAPRRYAAAHCRALRRSPGAWARCLRRAVVHAIAREAFLRAPLVAEHAVARGWRQMHAHFASLPAVTAMLAAELARIPFSFTAHAKDIFLDGRSPRLLAELCQRARRVITVSDFNVSWLQEIAGSGKLPPDRIVRVYNGIDRTRFRPSSGKEAPAAAPLVLAVGRLVEKKGFGVLVEACARLAAAGVDFRCEIVGKGPLEAPLATAIDRAGLSGRVRLVGPLPRGRVAERLAGATLLAVPCVVGADGNRDGLPTVIPEAMAAGLPVVATRVTGIPEAVEHGATGLVIEPNDAAALAAAIGRLLADAAFRERAGRAGRRLAEARFDLVRNVATLDRLLHAGPDAPVAPDQRPSPAAPPTAARGAGA